MAEATVFRFCWALGFEGLPRNALWHRQYQRWSSQRVPEPDAPVRPPGVSTPVPADDQRAIALSWKRLGRLELLRKARQVYCLVGATHADR